MAFTGKTIDDLDASIPTGSSAPSTLDNSDREVKSVLKKQYAVVHKTANYTADEDDTTITVDTTASDITITLPAVATVSSSTHVKRYTVIKTSSDANTVIVDGDGSEKVDGANTQTIENQYQGVHIEGNGTAWFSLRPINIDAATLDGATYGTGNATETYTGKSLTTSFATMDTQAVTVSAADVLIVEWSMRYTPSAAQGVQVKITDAGGGTPWLVSGPASNVSAWDLYAADTGTKELTGTATWIIPAGGGGSRTLTLEAKVLTGTGANAGGQLGSVFIRKAS